MFLITGHSRSGTMYMSVLMKRGFGFNVGHEKYQADGISAWQLAPADINGQVPPWDCPPPKDQPHRLIHVVRNPFKAIPSVMHRDFGQTSNVYRRQFIDIPMDGGEGGYKPNKTLATRATLSYCRWNALVAERKPELTLRVEDAPGVVEAHLGRKPHFAPSTTLNNRSHPVYTPKELLAELDDVATAELRDFCDRYGYGWPVVKAAAA